MFRNISIVPRWVIFLLDIGCTVFAFFFAILINQNLNLESINWNHLKNIFLLLILVNTLVFSAVRTYSGIVRYTGFQDALRIFLSLSLSAGFILILSSISSKYADLLIPSRTVIILYETFSFLSMLSYRVIVKFVFHYANSIKMTQKTVVIFGAGEAGVATKRVLELDTQNNIYLLAFIDDDKKKNNRALDGIPILSELQFKELLKKEQVDELVIASFTIGIKRKNEIVDFCLNHDIKVLNVPPYRLWSEGSFTARQLKSIKIEELLEREPISINNELIGEQIKGKRILVSGAAGSIGSEIVRQLLQYKPELIILCDQAESPLYSLELELQETKTKVTMVSYLSDITNELRMRVLFEQFKPQYVYHAAAYKHVPMMELCPEEAIRNNVFGTKLLADLAVEFKVERFVMVSTDKAVNPTNVMGASKRIAEMYVQALSRLRFQRTKFVTTRFGNVLGSNGSVILRFKEQIEKGGPVTVTHPNVTRYFMTIPEACQLVLEAASMGNGGEIFVFDMGDSVNIANMAKKMIRLYGLLPNIDININYIGLRPGEKLYEELLNDEENTVRTYHEKICIAKVREIELEGLVNLLEALETATGNCKDTNFLVGLMKEIVPEFVSNNSVFEALDNKYGTVISINKIG